MNLNILIFDVLSGDDHLFDGKNQEVLPPMETGQEARSGAKKRASCNNGTWGADFVDDYFNCLTVGSVMRPVTDRYKVSRAKLAYIIDSTAAPVCIIAPISSWAAAVNSYVPDDAGITGFQLFLRTIPYNLYALLTLAMVLFVVITGFDFGQMKRHEKNAANGDLFTSGAEELRQLRQKCIEKRESDGSDPAGSGSDPVCDRAMIYAGYLGGATDVFTAFSGCDAETSLILQLLLRFYLC